MKKILFIHHGESQGGAPRSLSFLIKGMPRDLYEVYVLVFTDYENNKKLFENVGAKVLYGRYMGPWHGSTVANINFKRVVDNILYLIPTYIKIKKIVKRLKPDLIHLNSTCLCFAAESIKKSFPNIPIICHVREPLLENFWGQILRKRVNKYCDEFIAIEKYDAQSLHTQKKVTIIYNFVDFEKYNMNIKSDILYREYGLNTNDKILLYLARICKENGPLKMIKKLKPLLQKRSDYHLFIVGLVPSQKSDYCQQVIDAASGFRNIHILEFRNDVPDIIASSNIMIVPFQTPHFSRSVIEGNAIGIPSISSNVGGLNELVIPGETGYLIDANTLDNLDEYIIKLMEDTKLYKAMINKCQSYAKENFNLEKNTKKTFEIYKKYI